MLAVSVTQVTHHFTRMVKEYHRCLQNIYLGCKSLFECHGDIAQVAEQETENLCVRGANPCVTTIFLCIVKRLRRFPFKEESGVRLPLRRPFIPIAQWIRVSGYEPEGREFKSFLGCHYMGMIGGIRACLSSETERVRNPPSPLSKIRHH